MPGQSGTTDLLSTIILPVQIPNLKAHNFVTSGLCCTTSNLKEPIHTNLTEYIKPVSYKVQHLILYSLLHLYVGSIISTAVMKRIRFPPTDQLHFRFLTRH